MNNSGTNNLILMSRTTSTRLMKRRLASTSSTILQIASKKLLFNLWCNHHPFRSQVQPAQRSSELLTKEVMYGTLQTLNNKRDTLRVHHHRRSRIERTSRYRKWKLRLRWWYKRDSQVHTKSVLSRHRSIRKYKEDQSRSHPTLLERSTDNNYGK